MSRSWCHSLCRNVPKSGSVVRSNGENKNKKTIYIYIIYNNDGDRHELRCDAADSTRNSPHSSFYMCVCDILFLVVGNCEAHLLQISSMNWINHRMKCVTNGRLKTIGILHNIGFNFCDRRWIYALNKCNKRTESTAILVHYLGFYAVALYTSIISNYVQSMFFCTYASDSLSDFCVLNFSLVNIYIIYLVKFFLFSSDFLGIWWIYIEVGLKGIKYATKAQTDAISNKWITIVNYTKKNTRNIRCVILSRFI